MVYNYEIIIQNSHSSARSFTLNGLLKNENVLIFFSCKVEREKIRLEVFFFLNFYGIFKSFSFWPELINGEQHCHSPV